MSADLVERLQQAAEWKGIALEEAAQEAVLVYVLGRNLLNKLWLGLDGPGRNIDVAESKSMHKRR